MGILRTDKISGLETPTAVTGSVYFDGNNDYLQITSTDAFAYGTGDFTWEVWAWLESTSDRGYIFDHGSDEGALNFTNTTPPKITYYNSTTGASGSLYNDIGDAPRDSWNHIAVVRNSGVTKVFLNGKEKASQADTHNYNTTTLTIGMYGGGVGTPGGLNWWDGYISNVRILKGRALYTADFTPPVHALEPIDGTVLLCCNNPDSAGAASNAGIGTAHVVSVSSATVSSVSPGLTRDFTGGTEFKGVTTFDTQGYFVPPSGTTTERFPNFGAVDATSARGLFGGGRTPSYLNTIDYVTISTTGNAQDFGDLTQARGYMASSSSRTRGVFNGGGVPSAVNTQDFITISSTGDASDFGELQTARYGIGNCSSSIRGVFGGGNNPSASNVIEFITIATVGNTQDFGDLTQARVYVSGCSSSTRGVFGGGTTPSDKVDTMDFITISSTGNATDFGNLTQARTGVSGLSSRTRGVFSGGLSGNDPYTYHDIIDYITIAALGNATDFGDLIEGAYYTSSCSSSTRGVIGGAFVTPAYKNTIQYFTIASTGDAQDFGDLTDTRGVASAVSNGHGGLG